MSEYEAIFRFADATLSLNKQALAILHYIAASEVEGCDIPEVIQTQAMKYGGKWGVCTIFRKVDSPVCPWLLIYFGEDPNSDELIVKTHQVRQFDDPTLGVTYRDFKGGTTDKFIEGDLLGVYTSITSQLLTYML